MREYFNFQCSGDGGGRCSDQNAVWFSMFCKRLVAACRARSACPLRGVTWNVLSVLWARFVGVASVSVVRTRTFSCSELVLTSALDIAADVAGVSFCIFVATTRAEVVFPTTSVRAFCALAVCPLCWCHGLVLGCGIALGSAAAFQAH